MAAIRWPAEYDPKRAKVFVSNEIVIPATAETVWAWLVRASNWPDWYANSADVVLPNSSPNLAPGMEFRWRTFGVHLVSTVKEFERNSRLAWDAKATGIDAYHAWLLERVGGGTRVVTEETQNGWLARMGKVLMPDRMSRQHQLWLEGLSGKAQSGPPR